MARMEFGKRTKTTAFAVAIAVVAATGGCGDDDADHVAAAFADIQARFAAQDARGVCSRITRRAQYQAGALGHAQPTTCERDVHDLFRWIAIQSPSKSPKAVAVAVDGDYATVATALTSDAASDVPFVKQDGRWKLDSFFAISGPPPRDMR
jgi:cytochrome c551/c552